MKTLFILDLHEGGEQEDKEKERSGTGDMHGVKNVNTFVRCGEIYTCMSGEIYTFTLNFSDN